MMQLVSDHRLATVEQHREQAERPVAPKLLHILRMILLEKPVLERGAVGVERDQHLLAVGGEGVGEELDHQLPSAIARCRACSSSLFDCGPAQPCSTLPAGS